jgi:hypothetical protein
MPSIEWLTDTGGWSKEMYYDTIKLVAVHSKLWVIARGAEYIHIGSFDTQSIQWNIVPIRFEHLNNTKGWNLPLYYKTINVLVVDHNIFLFGRGSQRFHIFKFDTIENRWEMLPFFDKFTDGTGWGAPEYYETIKATVLNQKLIFFARGSEYLQSISFNTTKNKWKNSSIQKNDWLSDSKGWNHQEYYKTIQISTIKKEIIIFGRGSKSIHLSSFRL